MPWRRMFRLNLLAASVICLFYQMPYAAAQTAPSESSRPTQLEEIVVEGASKDRRGKNEVFRQLKGEFSNNAHRPANDMNRWLGEQTTAPCSSVPPPTARAAAPTR